MFFRRKEQDSESQESQAVSDPSARNKQSPEKFFEYVGGTSLTIKGTATGRSYHFRYPGHKLKVAQMDAYALFAESDLRLVR